MTQGSLGREQAPARVFATLFCLSPSRTLPFVLRYTAQEVRHHQQTPSGTGKGELLLTWVISVSHAEAKPEPMEMPVTLITCRRDRGTWPTALPPSQLGGDTALLQVVGKFSSPFLFLGITQSR